MKRPAPSSKPRNPPARLRSYLRRETRCGEVKKRSRAESSGRARRKVSAPASSDAPASKKDLPHRTQALETSLPSLKHQPRDLPSLSGERAGHNSHAPTKIIPKKRAEAILNRKATSRASQRPRQKAPNSTLPQENNALETASRLYDSSMGESLKLDPKPVNNKNKNIIY